MSEQWKVGQLLGKRGYTSKSATAHLVKAGLKMLEECCEYVLILPIPVDLAVQVGLLEKMAKYEFDKLVAAGDRYSPYVDWSRLDGLESELADVQVTVFDSANAIERCGQGELFDVVQAAVEKATADVERGIRQ